MATDRKAQVTWEGDLMHGKGRVETVTSGALGGLDAWVTGLRREQSTTRAEAGKLEWDDPHGLWKVNPLADWSDRDVWRFIAEHELPYHPLHDQGYESIGDTHSTVPGKGREGRWAGTERTECGLHT